jgi:hypothetical protein
VLHIEEVWGQGALGRIGVVGCTLPLLLFAHFGLVSRASKAMGGTQETILQQARGDAARKACAQDPGVEGERASVQDGVGMVDVGARQVGNSRLQSGKADDDLRVCQLLLFWRMKPRKSMDAGASGVGGIRGALN